MFIAISVYKEPISKKINNDNDLNWVGIKHGSAIAEVRGIEEAEKGLNAEKGIKRRKEGKARKKG